ncbi:MAG: hypothetical protein VYB55_01380 [Bacteroidota bacterium]|nr:hypothetical protein [Bacteroidota bacterium]
MTKIDFKVKHDDNRGVYYSETDRCHIFLPNHETIEDIYKTIDHEVFHACFDKADEAENMDEEMEERLIFCLQWAPETLY